MGKITDKMLNLLGFEVVEEEDEPREKPTSAKTEQKKVEDKNEDSWYSKMTAKRQERIEREARKFELAAVTPTMSGSVNTKMVVCRPSSFDNSHKVADNLRDNHCVVVDLTDISVDEARRVLDYLSGVAFAIGGKASRVGTGIFLFVPANVSIEGASDIMSKGHNFNHDHQFKNEGISDEERTSLFKTISA